MYEWGTIRPKVERTERRSWGLIRHHRSNHTSSVVCALTVSKWADFVQTDAELAMCEFLIELAATKLT
jgi:hypothetical protein